MARLVTPAVERFTQKVDKNGPMWEDGTRCWLWLASKTQGGYGTFGPGGHGKVMPAHRWSYGYFIGTIPANCTIDHLCKRPSCVNPLHLEPVSLRENQRRSPTHWAGKAATQTHCAYGHEYTEENTYRRKDRNTRDCRTCIRERYQAWKARKQEEN